MSHLHGSHEWSMVVVSVLMPILTSYTAFDLVGRAASAKGHLAGNTWRAAAACVMGGGIWSMHFVAMLAFQIPGVRIGYDPSMTALSFVLAVLVTGSFFVVLQWPRGGALSTVTAGVFMGFGIVIMHYVSMEAMRLPATVANDIRWVAASVALAVFASVGGLWLSFRHSSLGLKIAGAAIMGIAVSGMHYAAMAGISFVPTESLAGAEAVLERRYILAAVASMTFAILATALVASVADRRMTAALRKETEALRASEERFRFLYRNAPMPLYTLGPDARIEDASDRWLDLMGYKREEVIGRPVFGFFSEDLRGDLERVKWPKTLRGAEAQEAEFRMVAKDGRELDVMITSRVDLDEEGEFRSVMCAVVDVTARRKAEKALVQAQKMEAVGRLTGGIAHDFNNLLAVVKGNLSLLRKRLALEGKEKMWLDNAIEAAHRGVSLTQRMLSFARRQEVQTEAVDLHALSNGMRELIQRSIGPRHRVVIEVPEELPPASADPNQTELALLNLCINARDAMPDGGQIRIEGREEGGFVCLSVVDTGIGMDSATLLLATEPFFTTKPAGKGTGLGLPMVSALAEQSGGRFVLKSSPGEGTTAELWLRKHAGDMAEKAQDAAHGTRAHRSLRVLVVDDDVLVGASTADMLEEAGHEAVPVTSGKDALEALSFGLPVFDLVVTDLAMPGMHGLALAAEIARKWPDMPVVVATGYSEHPVPESLAWKLAKPFSQEDLVRTVCRAWIGKKGAAGNLPQGDGGGDSGSSSGSSGSVASTAMSNLSA